MKQYSLAQLLKEAHQALDQVKQFLNNSTIENKSLDTAISEVINASNSIDPKFLKALTSYKSTLDAPNIPSIDEVPPWNQD